MPQLKSGRYVALSVSPYLHALTDGPDEARYFAIAALRLHAWTPEALRGHVIIGYFDTSAGTPPDAPSYDSGYCVDDILQGRSDWSADEIEEFRMFLATPRMEAWLKDQFDAIDRAIRENPVWGKSLLDIDPSSDAIDEATIKRAIILRSAIAADAMTQFRRPRDKE